MLAIISLLLLACFLHYCPVVVAEIGYDATMSKHGEKSRIAIALARTFYPSVVADGCVRTFLHVFPVARAVLLPSSWVIDSKNLLDF